MEDVKLSASNELRKKWKMNYDICFYDIRADLTKFIWNIKVYFLHCHIDAIRYKKMVIYFFFLKTLWPNFETKKFTVIFYKKKN